MKKVFLYRIKDSEDRDCCAYIENNPMRFECGHYFGRPVLHGSCYCNSDWAAYDEIETVLTEAEYSALIQFDHEIGKLGYGIKKDDDRYLIGLEMCQKIQFVYNKLNGEENEAFYQQIIAEEKQIVMDEYDMTKEQVDAAFNNYLLEYQDRSIIGSVFDDVSDLGYEEAFSLGYIKKDDYVKEYDIINEKMVEHYSRTQKDIKEAGIMTSEQLNTMAYGKPLDFADRVDQTIYLTLTQLYMIAAAIFGMPEYEKAHKRITNNNTILMIKG